MGVSIESGNKGGRRSVDAELNLIPFIDLLSVCTLFLLMTAVWVQISKMSAISQPSGEATISHSEVSSITEAKEDRDFEFLVRTIGIQVLQDGKNIGLFKPEEFRAGLTQKLLPIISKITDPKISLRAEDKVVWDNVILVLDSLFSSKLTNVTIAGLN